MLFSTVLSTTLFALAVSSTKTITVETTITTCPCTTAASIFTSASAAPAESKAASSAPAQNTTPAQAPTSIVLSSTSQTTTADDSGCSDPSTLGADCSATGNCCYPLSCDVGGSMTCINSP